MQQMTRLRSKCEKSEGQMTTIKERGMHSSRRRTARRLTVSGVSAYRRGSTYREEGSVCPIALWEGRAPADRQAWVKTKPFRNFVCLEGGVKNSLSLGVNRSLHKDDVVLSVFGSRSVGAASDRCVHWFLVMTKNILKNKWNTKYLQPVY